MDEGKVTVIFVRLVDMFKGILKSVVIVKQSISSIRLLMDERKVTVIFFQVSVHIQGCFEELANLYHVWDDF